MDQSGGRKRPQGRKSTGGKAPRKMAFLEKPKDPRQIRYERNIERGRTAEMGTQTQNEKKTQDTEQQTYGSSSDAQTQTRDAARTVTTGAQTLLSVRNPDAFHDE